MMMFYVSEDQWVDCYAETEFNCRICFHAAVTDALRIKTAYRLNRIIPLWVCYETVVKCATCDATHRSSATLDHLETLSTEQRSDLFKLRIDFLDKFFVIVSLLFACVGPLSLVLCTIALYRLPAAATGWRRAAKIGLVLGVIFSILMAVLIATS